MSDGQNTTPIERILDRVLQAVILVVASYSASVSNRSHEKIVEVEAKQDVAARKADVVKEKIEAREDGEAQALGVQLYSTYRYLEDVATASGSPRDVGKAAEAKKVYEDYVRKHGAKP